MEIRDRPLLALFTTAVRLSASIRFSAPAETRPPCMNLQRAASTIRGAINTWRVQ